MPKLQFLDSFNTGVQYTTHGQRIGLWLILVGAEVGPGYIDPKDYRGILLVDYDRGLEYVVLPPRSWNSKSKYELVDYAMRSYLWNENLTNRYVFDINTLPEAPVTYPSRRFG